LRRAAAAGAVVRPCERAVDLDAASALAERVRPGTLVCAGAVVNLPGCDLPVGPAAARRFCQSVYKPTDNWFARRNRRVSLPISRWLCDTGISPSAVSLIGLGFALVAAAFSAVGGYGFALVRASSAWFSSMFDGCAG